MVGSVTWHTHHTLLITTCRNYDRFSASFTSSAFGFAFHNLKLFLKCIVWR